ncbi:ROK family transcriptional regulator [Nonomuraea sp. 3-1Str]|uniref:ROK family transcriptional regulator n=1 Tax=Nonomuraea sp. 3-1Str TaxID=2929801 RepID=UPI002862D620|nr:ROK family transcriptional regulator [Nonomuraea sp. 3-1Str]MDR8411094.1 ROK family transcriptional regulator [Nonomuraea sp. 3-1Str]
MKSATPSLARAINDRLALDLLLQHGPLTAPQLRDLTGLSRPTVSDLIERLMEGGLIQVTGEYGEDRRGPNARLYGLVAERAHVAGVDVRRSALHVTVVDITGHVVGSSTREIVPVSRVEAPGAPAPGPGGLPSDLPGLVAEAVVEAAAGRALETVVIGAPGLVDPRSGDLVAPNDVPGWRPGLSEAVRRRLGVPVTLENEVNLAAVAEWRTGSATGREDFVLLWLDDGIGAATVLGGRLRRGVSGGAGEIGFLEVDGRPYCDQVAAGTADGLAPEVLAERVAKGAAALVSILDPGLVVLGGKTGRAGGDALAALVSERTRALSPAPVEVRPSTVAGNAVLQGAVLTALDLARDTVFG